MRIYKIDSSNFGNFKSKLPGLLRQPNIMGVFSKGCGHCHAMEPAWNQLKSRLSQEKCNGGLIEIDSQVVPHIENPEIRQKINGYPTIMIIRRGQPQQEYSGNRSVEDMYNFCKQHLIHNTNTGPQSRSLNSNSSKSKKTGKRTRSRSRNRLRRSRSRSQSTRTRSTRRKNSLMSSNNSNPLTRTL